MEQSKVYTVRLFLMLYMISNQVCMKVRLLASLLVVHVAVQSLEFVS